MLALRRPDPVHAAPPAVPAGGGGLSLAGPSLDGLPEYAAALRRGWSPDNGRDVSGEQLALLAAGGPEALLRELARQDGPATLPDGSTAARVPSRTFWLREDGFAGCLTLRFLPGTHELPAHVPGHVGYAVVPWMRGRGIASRALGLALGEARALGLRHVDLACVHDNEASRRVIRANGGELVGLRPHPWQAGKTRLLFRIRL